MGDVTTYKGAVGLENLHELRQFTEHALKERGLDDEACANLVLVADEWVTNVLTHGYQGNKGRLEINIETRNNLVTLCFADQAPAFDLTTTSNTKPGETAVKNTEPGGLGLVLIRRLVSDINYSRSTDGWNKTCFSQAV